MKKNDNEIKLLIFLVVFIVFYGFYTFLLKPKIDSTAILKEQVDQEDLIVREMFNNTLRYDENVKKINSVSEYILENSKSYYVSAEQEDLIDQIEQWLNDSDLKYESIKFEEPCYYNLKYVKEDGTEIDDIQSIISEQTDKDQEISRRDYDIVLENSGEGTNGEEIDLDPVLWHTVTISAVGKKSAVKKFLNELSAFDKKTISSEFSFEVTPESIVENVEDAESKIDITINFLNLTNIDLSKNNGNKIFDIPEMPTDFVMPENFSSGAYKKPFSFKFIKNLF